MFKLFVAAFNMNQIVKATLENALKRTSRPERAALKKGAALGLLMAYGMAARAKRQIAFHSSSL